LSLPRIYKYVSILGDHKTNVLVLALSKALRLRVNVNSQVSQRAPRLWVGHRVE